MLPEWCPTAEIQRGMRTQAASFTMFGGLGEKAWHAPRQYRPAFGTQAGAALSDDWLAVAVGVCHARSRKHRLLICCEEPGE